MQVGPEQHTGHTKTVTAILHYAKDNNHFLITAGLDNHVKIWQFDPATNSLAPVWMKDIGKPITSLGHTTDAGNQDCLLIGFLVSD